MPKHIDGMDRWSTETWYKEKGEELIIFNFKKDYLTKNIYQSDTNRIKESKKRKIH